MTDWWQPAGGVPRLLLWGLTVALAVTLVVAGTTSTAAFGAYNPGWEGTGEARRLAEGGGASVTVAEDAAAYERLAPRESVAVVLAPDRRYDDADVDRLRSYVASGGTLVVAGDVGPTTNALLADLGAASRLDGRPLRDAARNYRSAALPVATVVPANRADASAGSPDGEPALATLPEAGTNVTLNHGTAVRPGPQATTVIETSPYAYLDGNEDGELDGAERPGPRAVGVVEPLGDGRVVVLGDPSVFIDVMLDRPGNAATVRGLTSAATGPPGSDGGATADSVLFDASHTTAPPPAIRARDALRGSPLAQVLVGGGLVALTGLLARRRPLAWLAARLGSGDPVRRQ